MIKVEITLKNGQRESKHIFEHQTINFDIEYMTHCFTNALYNVFDKTDIMCAYLQELRQMQDEKQIKKAVESYFSVGHLNTHFFSSHEIAQPDIEVMRKWANEILNACNEVEQRRQNKIENN